MGSKPPGVKLTNKNINCVKISSALKNDIQPYMTKNLLQHLSYMLILLSNLVNEEEMVGKILPISNILRTEMSSKFN